MKNGNAKLPALCLTAILALTLAFAQTPKRINKAVELLLSQGQPIYYTGGHEGTGGGFEAGKKRRTPGPTTSCTTWSTPPSTSRRSPSSCAGWHAGGPTKSGHRTPAVVGHLADGWHR